MVDHAGEPVMGGFGSDFDGIPVGDQEYVRRRLEQKLRGAVECMDAIDNALNGATDRECAKLRQTAFALHRACAGGKLGHLMRCAYPADVRRAAESFDLPLGP